MNTRLWIHIRLDRLGDRANLINLEEKTVAGLLLDGRLDTKRVRHGKVIADNLDAALLGEVRPSIPVILVEGVLNRDDRVLLDVAQVEVGELNTRDPLGRIRVGVLEVKVVLAVLVKLGRGDVKRDLDLALVTRLLDSLGEQLKRLLRTRDIGRKPTLITNVDGFNEVSKVPCENN